MTFLLICFFLLPLQSYGSSNGEAAGYEVAKSIKNLAMSGTVVDLDAVAKELRLPELSQKISWSGPFARYDPPHFSAIYKPQISELGIDFIRIEWSFRSKRILNSLTIKLNANDCPNMKNLEAAFERKAEAYTMDGPDGGPSYNVTYFTFKQPQSGPVTISFNKVLCEFTTIVERDL